MTNRAEIERLIHRIEGQIDELRYRWDYSEPASERVAAERNAVMARLMADRQRLLAEHDTLPVIDLTTP